MDIERIARKLEPLRPEDVRHWMRVRDLADPDLRSLLEKQIVSTAHRVLGDFRGKPLLSLPPEEKARGTFNLGTIVYEKDKWPLGISKSELLQNLAIFGRSGAGKTNLAFHLLTQLVQHKIPFLFLDWKRTARHLLPYLGNKVNVYTPGRSLAPFIFNPFIPPPGMEHHLYINHLVDVLGSAFTLGDGAKSVLQQALASCYQAKKWPTVEDVLSHVEQTELKGRAQGWKTSALRALRSLSFAGLTRKEETNQRDLIASLMKANTIVELNGLHQNAKAFLIPMLCLWLYYVKLGARRREQLDLVIVVEEAHHVLYRQEHRAKETVMNMLLRQCREIGIGMIIVDQHPHLISSAALGNTFTSVCLNLKDPADINRAGGLSLLDEQDKKWLSMLPVGQGIVKLQDRWFRPFLVQFPWVRIEKGAVTDTVLKGVLDGSVALSELRGLAGEQAPQDEPLAPGDRLLSQDEFIFLHDILQNREDGVDARYKRLGIGANKGNRVKETLVQQGWLEEEIVPLGRTRKVALMVPERSLRLLGFDLKQMAKEHVVHEYWKRFYARIFQDRGYDVTIEASRHGGRVDVLATKKDERIGIEIETGKSDVVSNVKQCLLSKFARIIVVATNQTALAKIERQLAQAGLVVPARIQLVLRDELGKE